MMSKNMIIGAHHDTPVRVTFPCSDLCPEYTTRIIRYDIEQEECTKVGGETRRIQVPKGTSVAVENFCFPKILVDNNVYSFVEQQ